VSDVKSSSLSEAFVVAGKELGFKQVDINGPSQHG
jgi:hypothetical protein